MATDTNYRIRKIADLAFYTEGPVVDSHGNFFCTTLSAGLILQIDGHGRTREWAKCKSPNGQVILPGDVHLVCDPGSGIRRFDRDGKWIGNAVGDTCAGAKVVSPNDLCCDDRDNIYFTDSIRKSGSVFFKGADGSERIIASGLDFPNGIVLSADGLSLLVAESYKNRVIRINLQGTELSVFADLPKHADGRDIDNLPDGMEMDKKGNIWVAHYGMGAIQVLSPGGVLLRTINTGLPLTSNLTFIDEHRLLFTGGFKEPGPGGLFELILEA